MIDLPIKPTSEIDQYQAQLINDINEGLLKVQQDILSQDLSRREFTAMLKASKDAVLTFTPKPIP